MFSFLHSTSSLLLRKWKIMQKNIKDYSIRMSVMNRFLHFYYSFSNSLIIELNNVMDNLLNGSPWLFASFNDSEDFDSSGYEEDSFEKSALLSKTIKSEVSDYTSPYQTVKVKKRWSKEEDEILNHLCDKYPENNRDWKLISLNFQDPVRTEYQCQQRWHKVLNPALIKGPWTKEEDAKVLELVHKYGPKRWSLIAKHLHGRLGTI